MLFHPDVLSNKEKIFKYLQTLDIPVKDFFDEDIVLLAFIHKSYASDYIDQYDFNERLEFLGDGILGAIINTFLFLDHPNLPESELTLYKIAFVREKTLAEMARSIDLGKYLFISKGEERNNGREKESILSDALEALIGAIYLSLGRDVVKSFLKKYLYNRFQNINVSPVKSYKTLVQEYIQKHFKIIPEYRDFESKIEKSGNVIEYKSEIYVLDEKKSEGYGISKKKAQENAAQNFYNGLTAGNSLENS